MLTVTGLLDPEGVSGRESSSFSRTCNQFSRYLIEKGSFGDLSLGLSFKAGAPKAKPETAEFRLPAAAETVTMPEVKQRGSEKENGNPLSLFPQHAGFDSGASHTTGNKSLISLDSPRIGAKEERGRAQMTIFYGGRSVFFDDVPAEKAEAIMQYIVNGVATNWPAATKTASICDLPLARKASLQRFLARRKERLSARSPYKVSYSMPISTKEESVQSKAMATELSEPLLPLSLGLWTPTPDCSSATHGSTGTAET